VTLYLSQEQQIKQISKNHENLLERVGFLAIQFHIWLNRHKQSKNHYIMVYYFYEKSKLLETKGRKAMGLRNAMIARLPEERMSKETKVMMKMILLIALLGILALILNSQFGGLVIASGFHMFSLNKLIMKVF